MASPSPIHYLPLVPLVAALLSLGTEFDQATLRAPLPLALQNDAALRDLHGERESHLCWPAALGMAVREQRERRFAALHAPVAKGAAAWTRYFAERCGTDRETGTPLARGIRCIASYYAASGYAPDVQVIGQRLAGFEAVAPAQVSDRAVTLDDLADLDAQDYGVILATGLYRLDAASRAWVRVRGHSVLLRGHAAKDVWRGTRLRLDVIDPARGEMTAYVRAFANPYVGASLPRNVELALYGGSFEAGARVFLLEDVVAFRPGAPLPLSGDLAPSVAAGVPAGAPVRR